MIPGEDTPTPSVMVALCWYIVFVTIACAAVVLVIVILTRPRPDQETICRTWDRSDVVLATRAGDHFTYRDHNGLPRTIEGAESARWDCDK